MRNSVVVRTHLSYFVVVFGSCAFVTILMRFSAYSLLSQVLRVPSVPSASFRRAAEGALRHLHWPRATASDSGITPTGTASSSSSSSSSSSIPSSRSLPGRSLEVWTALVDAPRTSSLCTQSKCPPTAASTRRVMQPFATQIKALSCRPTSPSLLLHRSLTASQRTRLFHLRKPQTTRFPTHCSKSAPSESRTVLASAP